MSNFTLKYLTFNLLSYFQMLFPPGQFKKKSRKNHLKKKQIYVKVLARF